MKNCKQIIQRNTEDIQHKKPTTYGKKEYQSSIDFNAENAIEWNYQFPFLPGFTRLEFLKIKNLTAKIALRWNMYLFPKFTLLTKKEHQEYTKPSHKEMKAWNFWVKYETYLLPHQKRKLLYSHQEMNQNVP